MIKSFLFKLSSLATNFEVSNQKDILSKFGILLDGKYRETEFDAGVYNYVEKYSK